MDVVVYGPLRSATGGKEVRVDFDGGTVSDALAAFLDAYPRARRHLYTDGDELRPSVRIQVDGERVDLEEACPADAELTLFPAMRGGDGLYPPGRDAVTRRDVISTGTDRDK